MTSSANTPQFAAEQALAEAEADCLGDFGQEGLDAGWSDLVHVILQDCPPELRREFAARKGVQLR